MAFSSSAFFGLLFLIFLLTILIYSLCSGLVSLLASQAHQHHGHLTNFWCFWQCGQVPTFFHDILIYWDAHVVITWDYYCHSLYVVSAATSQNMESSIACHVSLLRVVRIKTTWKICFLSCRFTFGVSGHLRYSIRQCKVVLYSDESSFQLVSGKNGFRVLSPKDQRDHPDFISDRCKSRHLSWYTSASVPHIKILNLAASVRNLIMDHVWIFHQDNDPKQTSKSTQKCVTEHKFKIMSRLSLFPDLNPIEN